MRRIVLAFGMLALLIVLAAAAVWLLADINQYRGPIQAQLERQLQRKVSLGKMTLGLVPFRFRVEDPVIGEAPGFGDQSPFIRADELDMRVGLLSWLRGNIIVDSLELQRPVVQLVKNKQGQWNFSSLGAAPAAAADTPPGSPGSQPAARGTFTLTRVVVRDGQATVTDLQQGQRSGAVYEHIDLTLRDYAAGRPFSFELSARTQGERAGELHLNGVAGPVLESEPANTPFRGTLALKEVGIDGLNKLLNTQLPAQAGSVSGTSQIESKAGALTAAGNLKIDRARFNGVDLGYPITADYNLASRLAEGILTISGAKIQLGPTPLSLAGSVDTNKTPVGLNLNIKSGDVSIAEIARLASAFGVAFAPGTTVAGRVRADVTVRGSAANPSLTGTIAGRELKVSGKDIPQPVDVKAVDLALTPTEIRSNEFNATSGKTTVTASFAVRQYASKSRLLDLRLRTPAATLPEVQSIAKAYGMTGLDQINGAGTLNLDLNASGPMTSLNSTGLVKALNGNMNLDFNEVRISGFNAARELANIGGFQSSAPGDENSTDIVKLSGRIAVTNGIARTDDLKAQLAIGSLTAAGTADLATEALNLKLSAVLSKAFSDKVGGTRVAGYMTTALSNPAGELVIPAIVTGTFRQPKFAPDLQSIVQMQKQRAISRALEAFTPRDDKNDKNEAQPAEQKKEGIKGILRGILGGKKPNP